MNRLPPTGYVEHDAFSGDLYFRCHECGDACELHPDHVVTLSTFGQTVFLCGDCQGITGLYPEHLRRPRFS